MTHTLMRALGAGIVLGALAWTAAGSPAVDALSNCNVSDGSVDAEEQAFLGLINAYRAKSGAGELTVDPALTRAATWMAQDLSGRSTFGHQDSLGRSPWTRMPDCGVAVPGGENIAAGGNFASASTALNAWINSPSHREVMLTRDFKVIGIARVYVAGSAYGWYWTTDFGYGGGPAAAPPAPTAVPATPKLAPASGNPVTAAAPIAAPAAAHPPVLLGVPAGHTLIEWQGGYVSPDVVFGPHSDGVLMVYVFDLGSQTWLRWGAALDPKMRTLTEMRTGVSYWIVASAEAWVAMD